MRQLLLELDQILRSGRPVCYTALVETRGSTPQKAGAVMLVFPDGSQVGTLGGGCVEAEVKRRALQLLDHGQTDLLTFQLDSDYGWDDGLICGGRMKMLVDPLRPGEDHRYLTVLSDHLLAGRGCTEAVIIDAEKSRQGSPGIAIPGSLDSTMRSAAGDPGMAIPGLPRNADRFLLDETGAIIAARATGSPPEQLMSLLRPLAERPRPYVVEGISFLPHLPRCRLVIVGAGHVGQKVAELASDVDFDVWVIDDRQEYCNSERFPRAKRLIVAPIDQALSGLDVDRNTYCIIVTRGHNHDEEALYHLAETPARYVGLIGSRRKIKLIFVDLLREGISRDALGRVFAPLGFDIGSQTVPEIAVSIVAELVAHRNLGALPERIRPPSLVNDLELKNLNHEDTKATKEESQSTA
jgi:xanthine dehydrogenase accessory factor